MGIDRSLDSTHKFCTRNRELIAKSTLCGCFYCLAIFSPEEIVDWVDWPDGAVDQLAEGGTALCPRCGIDSVLPNPPVAVDPQLLADMKEAWF
jgi:hypothetical protein